MKYKTNPDREFVRNKQKAIKKNNGFCLNCPKTEDWRCPCVAFREQKEGGWCAEGLYYKEAEEDGQ